MLGIIPGILAADKPDLAGLGGPPGRSPRLRGRRPAGQVLDVSEARRAVSMSAESCRASAASMSSRSRSSVQHGSPALPWVKEVIWALDRPARSAKNATCAPHSSSPRQRAQVRSMMISRSRIGGAGRYGSCGNCATSRSGREPCGAGATGCLPACCTSGWKNSQTRACWTVTKPAPTCSPIWERRSARHFNPSTPGRADGQRRCRRQTAGGDSACRRFAKGPVRARAGAKKRRVLAPLRFQSIPHRGACGKTRVVPQNGRPRARTRGNGVAKCVCRCRRTS